MRDPELSLVTADFGDGPSRAGILTAEGIVDLGADTIPAIVGLDGCTTKVLRRRTRGRDTRPGRLRLPLRPGKVLAVGRNYAAHAAELGNEVPEAPFFFGKSPSTAIGSGAPIVIPNDLEGEVHHEAELAVVIGRTGRRIPRSRAMDYVAGYMAANDVTARTLQAGLKDRKLPWFAGKNLDTFLVLGPGLVPADAVPDVSALRIRCLVNDEVRQDGTADLMLNDVPALVEFVSRHLTLEPLDVILTGTPAGVGPLVPGDTVVVEIEGVGRLRNPVIRE